MEIKVGDKFVKNGEVVEVLFYDFICTIDEGFSPWAIVFRSKDNYGVLAYKDFVLQYKPYEPVYKYKYAFINKIDGFVGIS